MNDLTLIDPDYLYKGLHEEVLTELPDHYFLSLNESVFIKNNVLIEYSPNQLNEGFMANLGTDVLELIVGGLSELTGTPADTLVNTATAISATENVIETIASLTSGEGVLSELKKLVASIDIAQGPEVIYNAVLSLIQKFAKIGGEKLLDRLQKPIDRILSAIARLMGKVVNVLVPYDPGVSGKLAEWGLLAVESVAEGYVFDLALKAYKALPSEVESAMKDPRGAAEKVIQVSEDAKKYLIQTRDALEGKDQGFLSKAMSVATDVATLGGTYLIKKGESWLLTKAIDYIEGPDFKEDIINTMTVAKSVMTFFFGLVAAVQIISRGEYKKVSAKSVKGKVKELPKTKGPSAIKAPPVVKPAFKDNLPDLTNQMVAEWNRRYKSILLE